MSNSLLLLGKNFSLSLLQVTSWPLFFFFGWATPGCFLCRVLQALRDLDFLQY